MTPHDIAQTLGANLRLRRHELDYTLADVSEESGISISHLSEVERGLKFPGADTLAALAGALETPVEDLFSPPEGSHTDPSVQAAPHLSAPDTATPPHLARRLEAAMVARGNRLPHVEAAAETFLSEMGRSASAHPLSAVELEERLLQILRRDYGVRIDVSALAEHDELQGLRAVSIPGSQPTLLVNSELLPSQRAFILAKEIGSFRLGTVRRTAASPWLSPPTWRDVRDNHATSYFAGCVLLPEHDFVHTMQAFLRRETWSPSALLQCMNRFSATPEMFFYRFGQVAAARLGLGQHIFMRLSFRRRISVSRLFNMTQLTLPAVLPLTEHVCRRWAGLRMLHRRAEERADGRRTGSEPHAPTAHAQRVELAGGGDPLLILAMSRPLQLGETGDSAVMMGIPLDEMALGHVRFALDKRLRPVTAGTTCERCPLAGCEDRQADPVHVAARERRESRSRALTRLVRRIDN